MKTKYQLAVFTILLAIISVFLLAASDGGDIQTDHGYLPAELAEKTSSAIPVLPGLVLGNAPESKHIFRISESAVTEARTKLAAPEMSKKTFVGVNVRIGKIPAEVWEHLVLESGEQSWRLVISSPGATFLRIHFQSSFPKAYGPAYLYGDPTTARPIKAVPTRTAISKDFWAPTVQGEIVHLEVLTKENSPPDMGIDMVSVGFRKLGQDTKESFCYEDPTCYPAWSDLKSAVGQMVVSGLVGTFVCTGSLVMDTAESYDPWFLTANHCLSLPIHADSLEVTWNYASTNCDGAPPDFYSLSKTTGSNIFFTSLIYDTTLVKLDGAPPAGSAYLGFTVRNYSNGDPITVLHHPAGAYLRIAFGDIVPTSVPEYVEVRYSESSTEGGSSGSALLNEDRRVMGVLSAGEASCSNMQGTDVYGSFAGAWYQGMRDILDNGDAPVDGEDDPTPPPSDDDDSGNNDDDDFIPPPDDDDDQARVEEDDSGGGCCG